MLTVRRAALVFSVLAAGGAIALACSDEFTVLPPDAGEPDSGADVSSPNDSGNGPSDAGADAFDGSDGHAPTFCDNYSPPIGIADHFCADFDRPPLDAGFTSTVHADGGLLDPTQEAFVSPPTSLLSGTVGNSNAAYFEWKAVGAANFTEAKAEVSINPTQLGGVVAPYNGTVCLLEITTNNALVSFCYAHGSSVQGEANPYFGYFVRTSAFGGAAALQEFSVSTALNPNQWTRVAMIWSAAGAFQLQYNGVQIASKNVFGSTDTVVKTQLGALAGGDVQGYPAHRMDNLIVEIKR